MTYQGVRFRTTGSPASSFPFRALLRRRKTGHGARLFPLTILPLLGTLWPAAYLQTTEAPLHVDHRCGFARR